MVILNGFAIRQKRNELGLSLRDFTEKAGYKNHQYFGQMEKKGRFKSNDEQAKKIAKALNMSVSELSYKSDIFASRAEAIEFLYDSPIKQRSKSVFREGLSQVKIVPGGLYVSFYDNQNDKTLGFYVKEFEIF